MRFLKIYIFVGVLFCLFKFPVFAESKINDEFYKNSLSDKLIRRFEPVEEVRIPILVYHYVEYVKDKNDTIRKLLSIEPHIFESQVRTLKDNSYNFITFKDLNSYFNGEKYLPKNPIILTFDDGYEDFYTDVMPILKKYEINATQFVISGFINKKNYMSDTEIKEIVKSGLVEIGAHTVHHFNLSYLSENEAFDEILASKKVLEDKYGVDVLAFAYPYGSYNESTPNFVMRSGFKMAVTTKEGDIVSKNKIFEILRIRPGIEIGDNLINKITIHTSKSI